MVDYKALNLVVIGLSPMVSHHRYCSKMFLLVNNMYTKVLDVISQIIWLSMRMLIFLLEQNDECIIRVREGAPLSMEDHNCDGVEFNKEHMEPG